MIITVAECQMDGTMVYVETEVPDDYFARDLGEVRRKKNAALNDEQLPIWAAGMTVDFGDRTERFALTKPDQSNITDLYVDLLGTQQGAPSLAGITPLGVPYHSDGAPCKYYTPAEWMLVVGTMARFRTYHTTRLNMLHRWVDSTDDAAVIDSIHYNSQLPAEYHDRLDYISSGGTEGAYEPLPGD